MGATYSETNIASSRVKLAAGLKFEANEAQLKPFRSR